jgi:hypothetical protein
MATLLGISPGGNAVGLGGGGSNPMALLSSLPMTLTPPSITNGATAAMPLPHTNSDGTGIAYVGGDAPAAVAAFASAAVDAVRWAPSLLQLTIR